MGHVMFTVFGMKGPTFMLNQKNTDAFLTIKFKMVSRLLPYLFVKQISSLPYKKMFIHIQHGLQMMSNCV